MIAYLDPAIVSVPNFASTAIEAQQAIERTIRWSQKAREVGVRTARPDWLVEEFYALGLFPMEKAISEFVDLFSLQAVFSVKDILRFYLGMITHSLSGAEAFDQECGSVEVVSCELAPDIFSGLYPTDLADLSKRACAELLALNALCDGDRVACFAAAVPGHLAEVIEVRGALMPSAELVAVGKVVGEFSTAGKLACSTALDEIGRAIQPASIWAAANCDLDVKSALYFEALKHLRLENPKSSLDDVRQFSLGRQFWNTAIRHRAAGRSEFSQVAFETCARLLSGSPKNSVIPFLDNDGDQRRRPIDGALAWRTHITKSNEALRLMFWETSHGIELANIGNKRDLEIF